jgi:hypothetical protein
MPSVRVIQHDLFFTRLFLTLFIQSSYVCLGKLDKRPVKTFCVAGACAFAGHSAVSVLPHEVVG